MSVRLLFIYYLYYTLLYLNISYRGDHWKEIFNLVYGLITLYVHQQLSRKQTKAQFEWSGTEYKTYWREDLKEKAIGRWGRRNILEQDKLHSPL